VAPQAKQRRASELLEVAMEAQEEPPQLVLVRLWPLLEAPQLDSARMQQERGSRISEAERLEPAEVEQPQRGSNARPWRLHP
jgi:hypothetical protein